MKHGPIYHFPSTGEYSPLTVQLIGINYCHSDYLNIRSNSQITVIAYVLAGQGNIRMNSMHYRPKQGDVFILPFGSTHEVFAQPDQEEEWTYIWFNVIGDWALSVLDAYHVTHSAVIPDAPVGELFSRGILDAQTKPADEMPKSLALLFIEIVMTLSEFLTTTRNPYSEEVRKIRRELDQQLLRPFDSKQLSRRFGLSFKQMNRLFKKEMNTTIYNYVLMKKIDYAKMMLRDTQLNVSEIAYQLGYANPQYFSTLFSLKTGQTPSAFRQQSNC